MKSHQLRGINKFNTSWLARIASDTLDLRGKREVVALTYGVGDGTLAGLAGAGPGTGMAVGGRQGMSDIASRQCQQFPLSNHFPNLNLTPGDIRLPKMILRPSICNARALEKVGLLVQFLPPNLLTFDSGYQKGVLLLSWCKQDTDLLLFCVKDNRALCWNPQTSEIIGEAISFIP